MFKCTCQILLSVSKDYVFNLFVEICAKKGSSFSPKSGGGEIAKIKIKMFQIVLRKKISSRRGGGGTQSPAIKKKRCTFCVWLP